MHYNGEKASSRSKDKGYIKSHIFLNSKQTKWDLESYFPAHMAVTMFLIIYVPRKRKKLNRYKNIPSRH